MKAPLRMRHERELCLRDENRDRKDEIDLRIYSVIRGGMKPGEKKKRHLWTTHRHSNVKSTSRGCHGNGTGVERAGQAESRRRGETSGCFEKVHTLLALCTRHLRPPSFSSLLVCRHSSPYRQWRLRPGCCTVSLTRGVLLDYDRKTSTRRISVSLFLLSA